MDQYGKRLLLAAAMLGAAALCAVLPMAEGWTADKPAQAMAPQMLSAQTPPDTGAENADGFFAVLRTDPDRQLQLLDENGTVLGEFVAGKQGEVTFSALRPGRYTIVSGDSGGDFYLWENAAVSAISGTLWSDGELLHLGDTPTVHLLVSFCTGQAQKNRVVTVTLTARDGTRYDRSLVAGQPGICQVEFYCLPPGDYLLRIDGKLLRNLSLTEARDQQVRVGY